MKIGLDTNVLVNYLLFPDKETIPRRVVWAAFNMQYDLRLSEQTRTELTDTVRASRYLSVRIEESFPQEFIHQLRAFGNISPGFIDKEQRIVRDANGDYLIAHGLLERIDCLVTGDKDLLVLGHIGALQIVTPAELMALLELAEE